MLASLFSSKTIEKILLFLFVNGKGYGTELAYSLGCALTPVQKALQRLENGGIITSYYEGKTRIYQFNPGCLFLDELQELLKKVYTLLSHDEKRRYQVLNRQKSRSPKICFQTLLHFWDKLCHVGSLSFNAKSKSQEGGWNGRGKGEVARERPESHVLIFQEKGTWFSQEGQETNFSNVFRWTLDRRAGLITLEHLRYGIDHPVFLFHLAPSSQTKLTSMDSHFCSADTYFGELVLDTNALKLSFRVIGPKKNEELDYVYF